MTNNEKFPRISEETRKAIPEFFKDYKLKDELLPVVVCYTLAETKKDGHHAKVVTTCSEEKFIVPLKGYGNYSNQVMQDIKTRFNINNNLHYKYGGNMYFTCKKSINIFYADCIEINKEKAIYIAKLTRKLGFTNFNSNTWEINDGVLLFKSDVRPYRINGEEYEPDSLKMKYNKAFLDFINKPMDYNYPECLTKAMEKFVGVMKNGEHCTGIWRFSEWYKNAYAPAPKAKNINNDYTEYLKQHELTKEDMQYKEEQFGATRAIAQILDEHTLIVRVGYLAYHYDPKSFRHIYEDTVHECNRIYFTDKGKVSIYNNKAGEWVRSATIERGYRLYIKEVINHELLRDFSGTKYIYQILVNANSNSKLSLFTSIITLMRHPILEKLSKANCPTITRLCLDKISSNFEDIFNMPESNKPLLKATGLSNAELHTVEEFLTYNHYSNECNIIDLMKVVLKTNTINTLTQQTFENLYSNLTILAQECVSYFAIDSYIENNIVQSGYIGTRHRYYHYRTRDIDNYKNMPEEQYARFMKFLGNMTRLCKKESLVNESSKYPVHKSSLRREYTRLLRDSIDLIFQIPEETRPVVDFLSIETTEELQRIHNELIEITTMLNNRTEAEKMEAMKVQYKKLIKKYTETYAYKTKEFIVKFPEEPLDLKNEGVNLNICIGGYCERYANKECVLAFVRRADQPNTSFYSVEIRNNSIIQIHGDRNRWIGNDPDAAAFCYLWFKDKGIRCDKTILTNKGAGYNKSNAHITDEELYHNVYKIKKSNADMFGTIY